MGISTQILGLIVSLSFLVIIHELGHYTFARIFHTRVDKFYMFFNPYFSIVRFKKVNGKMRFKFFSRNTPDPLKKMMREDGTPALDEKGKQLYEPMTQADLDALPDDDWRKYPETTEWGIGWLPFGGYCAINGMIDETTKPGELPAEPQPYEFRSKPAWQRLFIIIGGVLVNFVAALILYVAIFFTWGEQYIPMDNAEYGIYFSETAVKAGFQNGDKIISVDGKKYEKLGDATSAILIDGAQRVNVLRATTDSTAADTVTVYLKKDFAQKVIGAKEKFICKYNMPFVIDSVNAGSIAEKAGLRRGDSLIAANGQEMSSFFDFQKTFAEKKNNAIELVYMRNNQTDTTMVTPDTDGRIGVQAVNYINQFESKTVEYDFLASIPMGIRKGFETLGDYVKQLKLIFTKEGATQLGGFGTIGSIFPKVWDWQIFWNMTAFLSIILAFMNFLPIPALDGGYILFILVEMITGRKPSDKFIGYANTIGFILLFALLIYANGLDILRAFH